jgi:hypothetical protein
MTFYTFYTVLAINRYESPENFYIEEQAYLEDPTYTFRQNNDFSFGATLAITFSFIGLIALAFRS